MRSIATFLSLSVVVAAKLPKVPDDVDAAKWVVDGSDTRVVGYRSVEADHVCTYPNDPTVLDDVRDQARTKAKQDVNVTHEDWHCGACEFNTPPRRHFAGVMFCASGKKSDSRLSVLHYPYTDCDVDEQSCQSPWTEAEKLEITYEFGIESGKFDPVYHVHTSCSTEKPADTCESHSSRGRICHCNSDCEDTAGQPGCCTWVDGTEVIADRFEWYTLVHSNVVV